MRSASYVIVIGMCLAGLCVACGGKGRQAECQRDGDCSENWRCDVYSLTCRCVNDDACDAALGERCMPDGTCQVYTGCASDEECGACKRCNQENGECLCAADCACGAGEKCNASGYCQPATGCFDNEDCSEDQFCDTTDQKCIPTGTCTSKYQCPFGQICVDQACVDGCEDHGDCELRTACVEGSCIEGRCGDDSFCGFMEYCQAGQCISGFGTSTPFCQPCDTEGGISCGPRANPCVIYPFEDDAYAQAGNEEYCGVDCSGGQRCPNGFSCNSLRLVKPGDAPDGDRCCDQTVNPECAVHIPCPGGLPCDKGPEEDKGYCPCTTDQDGRNPCNIPNTCLMDTCGPMFGKCVILGIYGIDVPCTQDSDCQVCSGTLRDPCQTDADCTPIVCELLPDKDYGGCSAGHACGLMEGFHCEP